jgi:phosphohistidine swiveling domain-containing protein
LVVRVDNELGSVPDVTTLTDEQLLGLIRGSYQALVAIHGYEVLTGMLNPRGTGAPTSAAAALEVVAEGRAAGLDDATILADHPLTLSLSPPSIAMPKPLPKLVVASSSRERAGDSSGDGQGRGATGKRRKMPPLDPEMEPDRLSVLREELRLRARWVQEITARVCEELGARLVSRGLLDGAASVRWLRRHELETALATGEVPDDLELRRQAVAAAPLPTAFRLSDGGDPVPVDHGVAAHHEHGGHGAGGGRVMGRVRHGPNLTETGATDSVGLEKGDILVVRTLDPGLAGVLPLIGGLVSETGSVLSHLAILARELGVPTVVGVRDALARFEDGATVVIDGTTGEINLVEGVSAV